MANEAYISSRKNLKLIDANMLSIIAIVLMVVDHLWATIVPGNQWMTWVGRMAFPIFAFQITEGYIHTSNFRKYALRLFLFGLISEIPFNYFYASSIFYPYHQNVMFTLLLGLLAINIIDKMRRKSNFKNILLWSAGVVGICLLATISFVDYGAMGVLTIVSFYLFRDFSWAWVGQFISLFMLNNVFYTGMYIPIQIFGYALEFQTQGFAIFALVPIWLYNGKKGSNNQILKYGFYAFYPAHLYILYLLVRFTG